MRAAVVGLALIAVGFAVTTGAAALETGGHAAATACKVTVVSARTRPPKPVPLSFDYGNASIAVDLNPPNGHLVAGRLPGGGERAVINKDGSISAKYGWWRSEGPKPVITGRRIDAAARPLRAFVPNGYGNGFQSTGLTFPTTGCWRVTGSVEKARLSFTVFVTKSRLDP